jgi:hypothetical protein
MHKIPGEVLAIVRHAELLIESGELKLPESFAELEAFTAVDLKQE